MSTTDPQAAPVNNAKRLLMAGFFAILAAGIGFGVRGGIMANWKGDFGFTDGQLGAIAGAGLSGFCFGIIIAGVIVDKLGYGKLVIAAFALHAISAFVTLGATKGQDPSLAFNLLYWGSFIFALGNGTLEGVANPLVSTLFPQDRTHYLNILHSSWPAGLVLGGVIGWTMGGPAGVSWKIQLGLYLIPTLFYGALFLGQHFPKSEAAAKGLPFGEMFKDIGLLGAAVACYLLVLFFQGAVGLPAGVAYGLGGVLLIAVGVITSFSIGSILLFVLFLTHALIGSVELGTDSWIQNITGNILTPKQGNELFIFTSLLMFCLRFTAHGIEKTLKLSPIGLLLICSCLAVVGLNLASAITTFSGALLAMFVYALGKTFFWPTMLAVVGDRFPRSGAIAMSIMGGIGMMSVGMVGGPGLGYAKDRFAGETLKATSAEIFEANKAAKPTSFLIFADSYAIDGGKLAAAQGTVGAYAAEQDKIKAGEKVEKPLPAPSASDKAIAAASIQGDRMTLKADSMIPVGMALIYLVLLIYFKTIGGYKVVRIADEQKG